jgi:hypothetical protein
MTTKTETRQSSRVERRVKPSRDAEKHNRPSPAPATASLSSVVGNRALTKALTQMMTSANARASSFQRDETLEREADQAASSVMSPSSGPHDAPHIREPMGYPPISQTPHASGGGGKAMDRETLDFFEHRYGRGFADVRIHNDSVSYASAEREQAKAFTVGNRIYFGHGEYQPMTQEGKSLLAHELAHVVQQTGNRSPMRSGSLAASLSRAPGPSLQRKLVATGDTARFLTVVNALMPVFQRVAVSASGQVTLVSNPNQGPPDREQQGVLNALGTIINDPGTTTVEFIRGRTSTNAAHRSVLIGAYSTGQIDLDDISALGSGLGGTTTATALVHELIEQYRKQIHGEAYAVAHPAGERAEEGISGATRGAHSVRPINANTIEVTVPWTYPDGRIVDVVMTITDGNVMGVRRTVRP